MTIEEILELTRAGYSKADIDALVSFQGHAPISGNTVAKVVESETTSPSKLEESKEVITEKPTEKKEVAIDTSVYDNKIKELEAQIQKLSTMKAETASVDDVSKEVDSAISSIISPMDYRKSRE